MKGGNLFVVGIGPGGIEHITPAARKAIESSDVVVGYKTYLELIPGILDGKETISSGMRQEVERCRQALELAGEGRTVALVSSGDAGIYGMAGLALDLADGSDSGVEIEIVPGVSALQAAAARLGAPLMHDFAVISLSDLLTPWETIRRRLEAAAAADFVTILYNPRSKGRNTQILEARDVLLGSRPGTTPVGIVRNATRTNESVSVTDLVHFTDLEIDMFSLVIIGNSQTRLDCQGRMVTPRGYKTCQGRRAEGEGQEATGEGQKEIGKRLKAKVEGKEHESQTLSLEPLALGRSDHSRSAPCRSLFIGGTGSDVGKSVIAAGICRLLRRRGLDVAPFKAQNMALNSAVTPEGGEIGRAQALQAAACRLEPHTDMNPILLKPVSEVGSQVIVRGRPVGNMTVAQYHAFKSEAMVMVEESFRRLADRHQVVVMEGAGSVAEINLKEHDLTNLRAAVMADAPVLLVADIDRGGVFASLVGTVELLEPAERERLAGFFINKFRGDASLLRPGIEFLEKRTGIPVLGVIPWIDLALPEEDSVALSRKTESGRKGRDPGPDALKIGVVRLPHVANYTDFDPLEREPGVELTYLTRPDQVSGLHLLILPGTKNTLGDLDWLRETGWSIRFQEFCADGGIVVGVCGGFQMLGRKVEDPHAVESDRGAVEGLGLLDVATILRPTKATHRVEAEALTAAGKAGLGQMGRFGGYEIHMGETVLGEKAEPLFRLLRRSGEEVDLADGAVDAEGRIWGTYLHGLFDNPDLRAAWLEHCRDVFDLLPSLPAGDSGDLDRELDRLADHLASHLDMEAILALIGEPGRADHA